MHRGVLNTDYTAIYMYLRVFTGLELEKVTLQRLGVEDSVEDSDLRKCVCKHHPCISGVLEDSHSDVHQKG